jgi:hypothetical protein
MIERVVDMVERFDLADGDNMFGGLVPGRGLTVFALKLLTVQRQHVVQIGERALLEHLFADGHTDLRLRRMQLAIAEIVQLFGRRGDGLHTRIIDRLFARRPGEREGFKV